MKKSSDEYPAQGVKISNFGSVSEKYSSDYFKLQNQGPMLQNFLRPSLLNFRKKLERLSLASLSSQA
jgi:hypothetical protein